MAAGRVVTFREFWQAFARVPAGDGTLIVPRPHREQERVITAVDSGRYAELLLSWGKKSAKSSTAALIALYHLTCDEREPDEKLIGIASFDEEQSFVVFNEARRFVERHPWLSQRIKVLRGEMTHTETKRDRRTGGSYEQTHRLRALARDVVGSHGEPWSLVIRDEVWSEPDHQMSEALIPSPNRVAPLTVYCSYAPLATMRRAGVPLHDLLERVAAGDPTLFHSFIGGSGDDASWKVCPWITPAWVEAQRRVFAAAPSRFRRVVLNEQTSGDGDTLLSFAEVQAAIDPTLPMAPAPAVHQHIGALDLGVSNDHAALVIGHPDGEGRFVVDVCQVWKPAPGEPVSFTEIEASVIAWARRLHLRRLDVDQWNAKLLVERLQTARVPARSISVEQSKLDKVITALKGAFSKRQIRIPAGHSYLVEQLESLRVLETRTPRRDLLKFAPSGKGADASAHDDACVALGLCLLDRDLHLGRVVMAEQETCLLPEVAHDCYLVGGMFLPHGAPCTSCPGHVSTRAALLRMEASGEWSGGGLRAFVAAGKIERNTWANGRRASAVVTEWF